VFGLIPLFFNLPVATEEKASPGRRAEAGKALNPRDHLSHLPDRSSLTARSAGCIPSLAFRNFELGLPVVKPTIVHFFGHLVRVLLQVDA